MNILVNNEAREITGPSLAEALDELGYGGAVQVENLALGPGGVIFIQGADRLE